MSLTTKQCAKAEIAGIPTGRIDKSRPERKEEARLGMAASTW